MPKTGPTAALSVRRLSRIISLRRGSDYHTLSGQRGDGAGPVEEGNAVRLDSVRELKASLTEAVLGPLNAVVAARAAQGFPGTAAGGAQPTIALGIVTKSDHDYALAVRIQRRDLENSPQLDQIRKAARGEVDVRYIGQVVKCSAPWQQKRTRPLKMGVSVGHFKISAGTLGCFVRGLNPRDNQAVMILSNNHVLANENRARLGDPILQSGPDDKGKDPDDRVATLTRMVKLKKAGANLMDAAVATLEPGIDYNARTLTGLDGALAGVGDPMLKRGTPVGKVGRTTGTTMGRAVAFDLDNLYVGYTTGTFRFDGQAEFEGDGEVPFGQRGDSGSLIVDADRRAIGLLFAVSDAGITSREVRVYANPLGVILRELKVELLTRSPTTHPQSPGDPSIRSSTKGGALPRSEITLEEARAAKPKALAAIGRFASVVGVGITWNDDGYALKVNLAKPPPPNAHLPEAIDGVPIEVEVVGTIRKA
jgi:hypothetical protein